MPPFFKKKVKSGPNELKPVTLQELQQQFNQTMFELGDLNYRKHMINAELAKINSEINIRTQRADAYGVDASKMRQAMNEEVAVKVEKGAPNADAIAKA